MKELDFTYELDGVCIGFNQNQIIDALRGVKNCLLTIGASSLSFIRELKATYGDYVTLINIFEDVFTVRQSVEKYRCFLDSEKITRIKANQQMQKLYLENTKIFDEIVLYTGENTVYDLCALEQQYDNIIKSRSEIEKRLSENPKIGYEDFERKILGTIPDATKNY